MITLDELSNIGFGSHLVTVNSREHYEALRHALLSGCNLVDTSANYMGGESEQLIGAVMKDIAAADKTFVVTKSGYDSEERLDLVHRGVARNNLMHPDFLADRIDLSLRRLQRNYIDGFLLHSPESAPDGRQIRDYESEFYARVKEAFEFLENNVLEGRIRYYGISSNTFNQSTSDAVTINLHRVLAIANEVAYDNHFRLIEFPYNLAETGASTKHHEGVSLIELAKENGLVTLSNRPLTAAAQLGVVRMADCGDGTAVLDVSRDAAFFTDCVELIERALERVGVTDNVMDFMIVKHLADCWMDIGNTQAVEEMFRDYFHPFLERIYKGDIPAQDSRVYRAFHERCILYSKRNMRKKTRAFHAIMVEKGIINGDDDRQLPVIACEHYLNMGIDHVLVGMRRVPYVDSLKHLF